MTTLSGVERNFKRGPQFPHFFKRVFFGGTNLKLIEKHERLYGGSGGMLRRNFFENLRAVMAILELFEYFLAELGLKFLTLILSASPNMKHFVRTFSIMRAYGVRLMLSKDSK